jgi:hypothetical protein
VAYYILNLHAIRKNTLLMKDTHRLTALLTFLFLNSSLLIVKAQSLSVNASVPAYISTTGLNADDTRHMEHDFTVLVPLGSGTVQVRAGFAEGDTSLLVRDFALGTHVWADSTRVAPSGTGHLLTFGRYTGIDAAHVQVYSGGSLVGSGSWVRP